MHQQEVHIRSFVLNESQVEYIALNWHNNRMRKERLPDDPPIPLEETIANLKSLPDFVDVRLWAAWSADQNEIVALGELVLVRMKENQHLCQFDITVLPEFRQRGLGRQLLVLIAEDARQDNRRMLMTNTVDRIPAGEAFMMKIGAQKGLEIRTSQLRMAELDHELLRRWLARGQENQPGFELGFWDGPFPEEQIQEIAELNDLMNDQPFGELEINKMHMTPEQLRQIEANLFARGSQRWIFYVIDRVTGKFAGYTETVWNANRPEILHQNMTGVFSQFRRKGLGRWLKAAMLEKVLAERPQVKFVRTGNADSNAAMLKINTEIGFKPYMAETLWQMTLEKVSDYLRAHEGLRERPASA